MHYHALCCWVAHCRCGRRSGCCCIVVLSVAPLALLCGESGKATRCSKYVFHFEHLPVIQQLCVMQSKPFSPTFQTSNEELTWPELSQSLRKCFAVFIFLVSLVTIFGPKSRVDKIHEECGIAQLLAQLCTGKLGLNSAHHIGSHHFNLLLQTYI